MITQLEWTNIKKSYENGNEQAFTIAFQRLKRKILPNLQKKIPSSSSEIIEDAYTDAILTFVDKCIIGNQDFPRNVEAYVQTSAHHKAIDLWRKTQSKYFIKLETMEEKRLIKKVKVMFSSTMVKKDDYQEMESSEHQNLSRLERAIGRLCEKCRALIEEHIFEKKTLRQLREILDYKSYQSIVDKKHRCLRKLQKLFYQELCRE